jgi:FMN-dependent NADH-azoreductase
MKLLYVKGSPREANSTSSKVAEAFLAAYTVKHPDAQIDDIDLWREALPEFDGDSAAAKMSFFSGGAPEGKGKTAWEQITAITQRFTNADDYLFTVPMWNGGIPYRLKLYIDLMTQPGLLFKFDPATGYAGLLKDQGKRATAVYTSGVFAPGVPATFGSDHHSTYFDGWLRLIGISDIATVRFQPTLLTNDPAAALATARAEAARAGQR